MGQCAQATRRPTKAETIWPWPRKESDKIGSTKCIGKIPGQWDKVMVGPCWWECVL